MKVLVKTEQTTHHAYCEEMSHEGAIVLIGGVYQFFKRVGQSFANESFGVVSITERG
jgi:hypothetical protein